MNSSTTEKFSEPLSQAFLKSYQEYEGLSCLSDGCYPDPQVISGVLNDLFELLFPGIFSRHAKGVPSQKVVAALIEKIASSLTAEISKQMPASKAPQMVETFLLKLPEVRHFLKKDLDAGFSGDPAAHSIGEILLSYPFVEAVTTYRIAHELFVLGVPLIPRMMGERAHRSTGIDIHPGAKIGASFFIDHGTGVVIGETCEIGEGVKIYHGVTLGARSTFGGQDLRGVKRHPTIGHRVTIYPGATILGGETTVGNDSTIGGNVVLMESVPPKSKIMATPPENKITSYGSKV
jgi:serine O-acetyltransferase